MNTDSKNNRARLLNMVAGGDGNTQPYIERVAYDDAPAGAEQYGYIVHLPQQITQGGISPAMEVHMQRADAARALLFVVSTGAKPRNPEDSPEAIAARRDSIPITDKGRHITYGSKA